jgi:hypothetical protein
MCKCVGLCRPTEFCAVDLPRPTKSPLSTRSVPPLTSVAGLVLARADAIAGSTFITVRSRSPLWETGRHPRNCSGSQDCRSRIYRGARARSPGLWQKRKPPRPINFFDNRGTNYFARDGRALRTVTVVVSERHHGRLLTCSRFRSALEFEQPCSCCSRLTYKL